MGPQHEEYSRRIRGGFEAAREGLNRHTRRRNQGLHICLTVPRDRIRMRAAESISWAERRGRSIHVVSSRLEPSLVHLYLYSTLSERVDLFFAYVRIAREFHASRERRDTTRTGHAILQHMVTGLSIVILHRFEHQDTITLAHRRLIHSAVDLQHRSHSQCHERLRVSPCLRCARHAVDLTIEGVLVECDPSIKAIIVKIDTESRNDFIIDDIDDEHVLIKSTKHDELKARLKEVNQVVGFDTRPGC